MHKHTLMHVHLYMYTHVRTHALTHAHTNETRLFSFSLIMHFFSFICRYYGHLMNTTISRPLSTLSSRQTTYKSCQALTFNILIADITRRPPIKLTNRWLVYAEKGKEATRKWLKMLTYYSSCFDNAVSKMGYCPLQYSNTLSDSLLS